jgi:hypothetical protein
MGEKINKVYFYCHPSEVDYQDDVVCLADGLQSLGIKNYGNCNYWHNNCDQKFLVEHDADIQPEDCQVVIVSRRWTKWYDKEFRIHEQPLPDVVLGKNHSFVSVFMDYDDSYESHGMRPEYKCFDVILRAKYNKRCYFPSNCIPWALGLSQRVLDTLPPEPLPFTQRKPSLLLNFGASHPYEHGTRMLFTEPLLNAVSNRFCIDRTKDDLSRAPISPWDKLMWEQTKFRHSRSYYDRLAGSQAVAAFCGEMIPPSPFRPRYLVGGRKAKLKRWLYDTLGKIDPRPPRSIQWDSWRFWEGLAAGCLVFNIDLDYYGVQLPVMPVNGKHYVGLRLDRMQEGVDEVLADPERMAAIAKAGREWAMEHYSPIGLAKQFLEIVETGRV